MTTHRLYVFENGQYSAAGPLISITPSWNPTILPTVTTQQPSKACVLPDPTCGDTFPIIPGKISPPLTFTRGSMTSLTGVILVASPGFAISKWHPISLSSSNTSASTSSLFTYNT